MEKKDFDAVVVGSGPNGLSAAITLQQQGIRVLLIEGKDRIGGGLRSASLTLPGFTHDVCSAVHPMAASSPFFNSLPLSRYGLEYIYPKYAAAHPFDDGTAAFLSSSLEETSSALKVDASIYLSLLTPILSRWEELVSEILAPLHVPANPLQYARFGLKALLPAATFAKFFKTEHLKGLWAGMAAHSIQPLSNLSTSAIGLVLMAAGHVKGWPIPKGGSASIANALEQYFLDIGGKIETNLFISSLDQLPSAHAVLFDVTPRQLLKIAGHRFSSLYKWQLERYRYGMGVYKIDWALAEPIPFTNNICREAGTLHLGNTFQEIAASEAKTSRGYHPEKPFVLLAQPSIFDPSRSPRGKHTAWAYCHVPNGSNYNMSEAIEKQVERFAPGFRDVILEKHTMNSVEMENYNPNYIGGDINGGIIDITQLFTRPAMRRSPYKTSRKGLYICSSSTPPGGGVHGMCGFHAARQVLKDIFGIRSELL